MGKQTAIWKKCNGEAHSNAFIDNCWGCAPYWENYPACPNDNTMLKESGYCKVCKKYFKIIKN